MVFDVRPTQQFALTALAGISSLDGEDALAPDELAGGTNRAWAINLSWRSTFGPALVIRQQTYLVRQDFQNTNQVGSMMARGANRSIAYRADLTQATAAGLFETGVKVERVTSSGGARSVWGDRCRRRIVGSAVRLRAFHLGCDTDPDVVARRPDHLVDADTRSRDLALGAWRMVVSPGLEPDRLGWRVASVSGTAPRAGRGRILNAATRAGRARSSGLRASDGAQRPLAGDGVCPRGGPDSAVAGYPSEACGWRIRVPGRRGIHELVARNISGSRAAHRSPERDRPLGVGGVLVWTDATNRRHAGRDLLG